MSGFVSGRQKGSLLGPPHPETGEKARSASPVPTERFKPPPRLAEIRLLSNFRACAPQREPVYLEARRVPPPAGSPPPLLRAASREALCWSKTAKNEASGPMGAKAMRADSNGKLQEQEPHRRPRWPCQALKRTLPGSLPGEDGTSVFPHFLAGLAQPCAPGMRRTPRSEWRAQAHRVQSGAVQLGG